MSQTTCLHPNDPQPNCGMACQECATPQEVDPFAITMDEVNRLNAYAALKVARDCAAHASEATFEIHARAVALLELGARGTVPSFAQAAFEAALAKYLPKCVTPTGEDFYAFGDEHEDELSVCVRAVEMAADSGVQVESIYVDGVLAWQRHDDGPSPAPRPARRRGLAAAEGAARGME